MLFKEMRIICTSQGPTDITCSISHVRSSRMCSSSLVIMQRFNQQGHKIFKLFRKKKSSSCFFSNCKRCPMPTAFWCSEQQLVNKTYTFQIHYSFFSNLQFLGEIFIFFWIHSYIFTNEMFENVDLLNER